MLVIENFNVYFGIVINAIFTGLGTGLGIYIANQHVIKITKRLFKKKKLILHKK